MSARDDRNKREAERTHHVLAQARAQERDALLAALMAEYVAILRYAGFWGAMGRPDAYRWGGRMALQRVAECLGVTNLHERAADVMTRGEREQP